MAKKMKNKGLKITVGIAAFGAVLSMIFVADWWAAFATSALIITIFAGWPGLLIFVAIIVAIWIIIKFLKKR